MFARTSNVGRAFQLDSVLSLEVANPAGSWTVQVKLSDGSTTTVAVYGTQADAQAAFEFLVDAVGWVKPPGSVS